MKRQAERGDAYGLLARAVAAGAEHPSPAHARWNISCRCLNPVAVDVSHSGYDLVGRNEHIWIEMLCRCRKCANCLKVRSWEWTQWARNEVARHPRSYFGTLTLAPEQQVRFTAIAYTGYENRYGGAASLSEEELWKLRVSAIGKELTNYLKRVRKNLRVPLRYLLVAEAHKSGDPHFHMLVHECERASPDAWDVYCELKSQWSLGFSAWSGIDADKPREARYVCKYLAKSSLARVRASERYGRLTDSENALRSTP